MPAFFTQSDLAAIESVVKALRKHIASERKAAEKILREPVSISRAKATTLRARADACSDAKQRGYDALDKIITGAGYWPRAAMCSCGKPTAEGTSEHYEIGSGGYVPR